jgi:hypothetical protein
MKLRLLITFLFLSLLFAGSAQAGMSTSTTTQALSIGQNGSIDINFWISWACDDYPQNSAPGKIQLLNSDGIVVTSLSASIYRGSGPSILPGIGTASILSSWVAVYCSSGAPADAELSAVWQLRGLAPGNYTLRLWNYTLWDNLLHASTVWTQTSFVSANSPVSNSPPTITWDAAPDSALVGQSYTVSVRGHDDDGNLTQVNIWKNGVPFAFAGGGNGTDGNSGNPTSDGAPQSVTFTAQAVDANGATSPMISHVVAINAPPNQPPTVTLNSPAAQTITAGTTLTISTTATDADGNLTNHNVDILRPAGDWNFQGGFASGEPFQGGPVGSAANSTRTANFTFSDVGTYTIRAAANDGSGWVHSSSVTITVNSPPVPNRAPTIAWLSAPSTAGHLQSYTVSARGQDADGNLTQVNIWKKGTPFAFAGGGTGFLGDSGNPSTDAGPQTITYTVQAVDASGATSPIISQTVTISGPPNTAPSIAWLAAPATVASGQSYTVSARGTDADGNLASVSILKDGAAFANSGGGTGATSDASATGSDTGPRTITFTAVATDAQGASSGTISYVLTVSPPPPVLFTLTTVAGSGGAVSAGGSFANGATAIVNATPDAIHDFIGWQGDASGSANPLSVSMDRNKTVQAIFALKSYTLTTSASTGGSVTGGGVYSYGTTITLTATASPTARFMGWTGDVSGTVPSVAVYMNGPKTVQALFANKTSQTLSFPAIADQSPGVGAITLTAVASSGLPVSYFVTSGPATVSGSQLQIVGPGAVTVEARQLGDDVFLPAPNVARSFNVVAAASLKYRAGTRTVLQSEANRGTAPFVLEKP